MSACLGEDAPIVLCSDDLPKAWGSGVGHVKWMTSDTQENASLMCHQYCDWSQKVKGHQDEDEVCAVSSSWPHVFLIELRWSRGSLILISGDRNPIFRGDS